MNAFEKVIHALQAEMTEPALFGWFHLLCLAITVALTVFLCTKLQNANEKTVRRLLLVLWIVLVLTEVYKQLAFALDVEDGVACWDYAFYAFPYQFCSTPLYILPLVVFLPDGKVRNACMCFLATFSLFAGLAVMCYPGDVFMSFIGINLQTMIHHGAQVAFGCFLALRVHRRLSKKYYFAAMAVFAALAAIALLLNVSVYHLLRAGGHDDTFNMFFISPYFDCTCPVLELVYPLVPYPVFLLAYLLGFALVAAVIFFGARGLISHLTKKRHASA